MCVQPLSASRKSSSPAVGKAAAITDIIATPILQGANGGGGGEGERKVEMKEERRREC